MNAALKALTLGVVALVGTTPAVAQIDGPTPLAWRWVHNTAVPPSGMPLVVGNTIYLAVGNRVFALDAATGNERWKYPRLEPIPGNFRAAPVLVDNTLVVPTDTKEFHGVDITNGEKRWVYKMADKNLVGQPVAAGKLVVFGQSDNTLMALDPVKGDLAWENGVPVPAGINGQLAVHGDAVLIPTMDNHMLSVSAVTQKVNWNARFGQLPPGVLPVVMGDMVYVYSGPYLVALNAIRGNARWQIQVGEQFEFGPAVSGDGIMAVTREGRVYFFTLNGQRALREVITLGSGPAAAPSAVGRLYAVPTTNGAINLVDPKSGALLWSYVVRPIGKANREGKVTVSAGTVIDTRLLSIPAAGPVALNGTTMYLLGKDGSLLAFDKKMGVDLTPPEVSMVWPTPGAQVSGLPPLELIFKVDDEATGVDLRTLQITVDDQPLKFQVGKDLVAWARFSHTSPTANKPLKDGRRILKVSVADWMGNSQTKTYMLTIDNQLPPLARPKGPGDQPGETNPGGPPRRRGGGKGGGAGAG